MLYCRADNAAANDDIPMFHNLSSLKFYGLLWRECYAWDAVRLLLCCVPKLQTLAFESIDHPMFGSLVLTSYLEEPLDIPECLSSHLMTSHYKGFSGNEVKMELVRQILKAARVLKIIKIMAESHLSSKAKLCIHKELMKFSRSSRACQIAFD